MNTIFIKMVSILDIIIEIQYRQINAGFTVSKNAEKPIAINRVRLEFFNI